MKHIEWQEQERSVSWLRSRYQHVYESMFRPVNEFLDCTESTVHRKKLGVSAGCPDLFHLHPCQKLKHVGVIIKMKAAPPEKYILSAAQRKWLERLNGFGYYATVCAGFSDYQQVIRSCYNEF